MALDAQRNWNVAMAEGREDRQERTPTSWTAVSQTATARQLSPPRGREVRLPVEILLQIIEHIATTSRNQNYSQTRKQHDLHSLTLVNRAWNEAATPFLYSTPILQGPAYDPFTRTICPSVNLKVRKSPLAHLVRRLDLSLLVHQGSKSMTARLLGRTKGNLRRFAAPQASFSLNCFPALAKCRRLGVLDLGLVSEAASLQTLFDTVGHLQTLRVLHLPRSAGFGASIDPSSIRWPARLQELTVSGGLGHEFWTGHFNLPSTLRHVRIAHCPHLEHSEICDFLITLSLSHAKILTKLTFNHLPRLRRGGLDCVLELYPLLLELSISTDYISQDFFLRLQEATNLACIPSLELDEEDLRFNGGDDAPYDSDASADSMTTSSGAGARRSKTDQIPYTGDLRHAICERLTSCLQPALPLLALELTDSGHVNDGFAIDPLDLLTYAQGMDDDDSSTGIATASNDTTEDGKVSGGLLPCLCRMTVSASLGWTNGDAKDVSEALSEHLALVAQELGLDDSQCGVRIRK